MRPLDSAGQAPSFAERMRWSARLRHGALAALLPVACARLDRPPAEAPDEGQPTDAGGEGPRLYLGRWLGTTSQDLPLSFTVDRGDPGTGVTFFGYAWQLPACACQDHITFDDPAPIRQGQLAVQVEAPGSLLDITVSFDDGERAHGTLAFTAAHLPDDPTCMGRGEVSFAAERRAP
jgi:hypothetical protein